MSENTTPVEPVATPGPRRWRPLLLGLAVALPVTAAGLFAWLKYEPQGERQLVEANYLGLDLARPDVLIESASLGRLPRTCSRCRCCATPSPRTWCSTTRTTPTASA